MSAPMITSQIKRNNLSDVQSNIFNRRIENLQREISALKQTIENMETGVPVGTVAFFNSENCPDDKWQNVTELGWGGYFFRVADTSNPRNTPQEQSIQEHWHNIPNLWDGDKSTKWSSHGGGLWMNTPYYNNYLNRTFAGDVYRRNHNFKGNNARANTTTNAPDVSIANETRPKNIPLTTCVKTR